MPKRSYVRTGTEWEPLAGYCRAVRAGSHVAVSGCAPVDAEGRLVGENAPYVQARRCIEIIDEALQEAGSSLSDVVRTRMYVTDIDRWEEVAKAHREAFADITPATSMVEVSRLIGEGMMVEIEADAIVGDS